MLPSSDVNNLYDWSYVSRTNVPIRNNEENSCFKINNKKESLDTYNSFLQNDDSPLINHLTYPLKDEVLKITDDSLIELKKENNKRRLLINELVFQLKKKLSVYVCFFFEKSHYNINFLTFLFICR